MLGGKMHEDLLKVVHEQLLESNLKLCLAESCTGGLLSHWVSSNPGASAYFMGGMVAYSNESKSQILGISQELLQKEGAVSRPCAEAMALGALELFDVDVALSITGIAGPSGGTAQKPVGLVFIGFAWKSSPEELPNVYVIEEKLHGSRKHIQYCSAELALELLHRHLHEIKKAAPPV
jgi:PncC family amidohydrolase